MLLSDTAVRLIFALILVLSFALAAFIINDAMVFVSGTVGVVVVTAFTEIFGRW
jgi:hypothetical protein